ncbi:MAG: DNA polymerase Y family protein, partial [Rhodoferax sp.]|nr:DNA polymerase Y family protein [Rhodoferax sp.]
TLQTQVLAGESLSLLPEDLRAGDPWQQLMERLSARLGPQQVLRPSMRADYRPERMQAWGPALDISQTAPRADTKAPPAWALYPTWLLTTPQPLKEHAGCPQYHGNLELLVGPQRLESGWLDGTGDSALRDYFIARSQIAGLVWIYRNRLSNNASATSAIWFLHGLFA